MPWPMGTTEFEGDPTLSTTVPDRPDPDDATDGVVVGPDGWLLISG